MKVFMLMALAGTITLCGACSSTHVAPAASFNGLSTPEGAAVAHLNTSNLALNLLFTQPLLGDASLAGTVSDFTNKAKEQRGSKVHIVQSDTTTWWWVFPPFSFVLTPVSGNVAGDVLP